MRHSHTFLARLKSNTSRRRPRMQGRRERRPSAPSAIGHVQLIQTFLVLTTVVDEQAWQCRLRPLAVYKRIQISTGSTSSVHNRRVSFCVSSYPHTAAPLTCTEPARNRIERKSLCEFVRKIRDLSSVTNRRKLQFVMFPRQCIVRHVMYYKAKARRQTSFYLSK